MKKRETWFSQQLENARLEAENLPDWAREEAGLSPKRVRGRPFTESPLQKSIKIRFNDEDYATIQQAAGNNISQWAREVLLAKAKETERK